MALCHRVAEFDITTMCGSFPGVTRVFRELEKTSISRHIPLEGNRRIIAPKTDVLILGAWSPVYDHLIESFKKTDVIIGILWTSTMTQSDMSVVEVSYINHVYELLQAGMVDFIWFGSKEWTKVYDDDRVYHMPYPVNPAVLVEPIKVSHRSKNVSLFCPSHPRKNILNQIAAARLVNNTYTTRLHTNTMMSEYGEFADKIGLSYSPVPWLSEDVYHQTVAAMDAGLQVSHNGVESFNYVVIDHLQQNVPVVMSRSIYKNYLDIVGESWIEKYMCVDDPTDIGEIAECVCGVLDNPRLKTVGRDYVDRMGVESYNRLVNILRRIVK